MRLSNEGGTFRVNAAEFDVDPAHPGVPRLNKGTRKPKREELQFVLSTPAGVKEVTLWFPEDKFTSDDEVDFDAGDGWAETVKIKASCPQGTYPFAVYLELESNFTTAVGPLHIEGNQFAEGHSHPACIVEP